MTDSQDPIELHTVWQWTCLGCGHVNTEDPPSMELTEEDLEQEGFEEDGEYVVMPVTVLCAVCMELYPVKQPEDAS